MEVPMICQLIANFCKNLRMQFIFSNPSHATHRPGLVSTILTALIGLEKTLQPLCSVGRSPSSDSYTQRAALSTHRVSWAPPPFGPASESNSGTPCGSISQLDEGCRTPHPAGGLFPVLTVPPTIGSSEREIARRVTQQMREEAEEGWDGTSGDPLDSFGQPQPNVPQWYPDQPWTQRNSPSRAQNWTP